MSELATNVVCPEKKGESGDHKGKQQRQVAADRVKGSDFSPMFDGNLLEILEMPAT